MEMVSKKTVMIAVLLSGNLASAEVIHQFTPVEELSPEQRQEVIQKFYEVTNGNEIDWDVYALGVNEQSEVTVVEKSKANLSVQSQPSSYVIR